MEHKGIWWKTLLIVLFCAALDMTIHALQSTSLAQVNPSYFLSHGLLVPAILVWELLAFGMLAAIFLLIEARLPGKGWQKGIMYGLSFGIMYQVGMFECVLLFHTKLLDEFFTGFSDFLPILILGLLLGIFTTRSDTVQKKRSHWLSILIVAFFFLAGRYFSYAFLHISSAYRSEPVGTLMWTLCMGLWVGAIYWMLQSGSKGKSIVLRALYFILIIYGPNWLINQSFMLTVIAFSPDLFLRVAYDLVFIALGVVVSGQLLKKKQYSEAEVHK